jgi:hypothetical protein
LFLGLALALAIVFMFCGTESVAGQGDFFKACLLLAFNLCFSYVVAFCASLYLYYYGAPLVL